MDLNNLKQASLISPEYQEQIKTYHAQHDGWGSDGWRHVDDIEKFADEIGARRIMDYGCGKGQFAAEIKKRALTKFSIFEYDPGIPEKNVWPGICPELVICTDVLEHIEPEKLHTVIDHIHALSKKGAYLHIATRPAKAILPDGRNAHLIVQPAKWWINAVARAGWNVQRWKPYLDKAVTIWMKSNEHR